MFVLPLDTSDLVERNKRELALWEERTKKVRAFAERANSTTILPSAQK